MIEQVLTVIRGLVRPLLTFGIVGLLAAMAYQLAMRFADKEIAIPIIAFLTGAGTMAFGYWFGERKKS